MIPKNPTPVRIETPYGLVYGVEGANFPDLCEVGPYATLAQARAAIDPELVARYGGWLIAEGWVRSDGECITTGAGRVVETERS